MKIVTMNLLQIFHLFSRALDLLQAYYWAKFLELPEAPKGVNCVRPLRWQLPKTKKKCLFQAAGTLMGWCQTLTTGFMTKPVKEKHLKPLENLQRCQKKQESVWIREIASTAPDGARLLEELWCQDPGTGRAVFIQCREALNHAGWGCGSKQLTGRNEVWDLNHYHSIS